MKQLILLCCLGICLSSCQQQPNIQKETSSIERGAYLVTIAGCNDCHSPKILTEMGPTPDPMRLLSGHPSNEKPAPYDSLSSKGWILFSLSGTSAHGPWGTSFAANITPDPTGIGNWTEEQFILAMQKGYYHGIAGTRKLLPPMPWFTYAKMKKEDIVDIFNYLKSIKPINNLVPAAIPPEH